MPLPPEWVHRATKLQWSTNIHGDESCQATLDLTTDESVEIMVNNRADPVVISGPLGEVLYQGRLEDPSLALGEGGAFSFASMGGWAALGDLEESYTALWSTTDYSQWREAKFGGFNPERWELRTNDGRLSLAPRKNEVFDITSQIGGLTIITPPPASGIGRPFVGMQWAYRFIAPANWVASISKYGRDYSGGALVWSLNATGALQTGAIHATFAIADRLVVYMFYNGSTTYTGETSAAYLELTQVRVVTSTTNRVNTTFTAARAAGTNVTATVVTTAGMYAGQHLVIDSSATPSEVVTVLSIPSTTQFNATFVNGYNSGDTVQAFLVYGDEIAADVASFVNSVNSDQLSASGTLSTMSLDLADLIYEDATPSEALNDLCTKSGDGTVWETGVDSGVLYLRPRGQLARAWLIDVDTIALTTSLADVINSAYAVYESVSGETVRSAVGADTTSIATAGITRRRSVSAKASSATQATAERDALLADKATPGARATLPNITALYDLYGNRWPLWEANAGRGDTITIRNIAPEVASGLEARLTFRLSRTTYDRESDTLTVELEAPRPGL